MKTKTAQTLMTVAALSVGLLAIPLDAAATPENKATYSISRQLVQAPNTGATFLPYVSDTQASTSYAPYLTPPVAVQVAGSADTGTNQNGLGYANGIAFARAEAGVLKATALAEGQGTARPDTNVGAGVTVNALAKFTDRVTFVAPGQYQNLLIVSGSLLLDGDMYTTGSYGRVKVGGTGLNPQQSSAEWTGESDGRQISANGVYSSWVPGTAVSIPFSFTVYSGQATELSYWLDVYASSGASFQACPATGGLCNVVQTASNIAHVDYGHTLAWGGVSVTDWFGKSVAFSSSSLSGFNYSTAYTPPVPVPAAAWLFGSGLIGLAGVARKRKAAQ